MGEPPPTIDYNTPPLRAERVEAWWRPAARSPWAPAVVAAALVGVQLLDVRFGTGGEVGVLLFAFVPALLARYLFLRLFGRPRVAGAFRPPRWLTLARLPVSAGVAWTLVWCISLWHRYYFTPGAWRMWWHPWIDLAPAIQLFALFAGAMLGLDAAELRLRLRHRRRRAKLTP